MPRTTGSRRGPLRQRVTWEDATRGELEILDDTFHQTRRRCPACGARLWTADPEHAYLCTHCGTLQGGAYADYAHGVPATGFWLTIVRQLQLAEAAEAAR